MRWMGLHAALHTHILTSASVRVMVRVCVRGEGCPPLFLYLKTSHPTNPPSTPRSQPSVGHSGVAVPQRLSEVVPVCGTQWYRLQGMVIIALWCRVTCSAVCTTYKLSVEKVDGSALQMFTRDATYNQPRQVSATSPKHYKYHAR